MSNTKETRVANRFGLKLTFCILEIISCVLFNPVTLVLAVIALIFTCNANKSYKKGDYEAYRGEAKVATALLTAGLIFDLIFGVLIAVSVNRLNGAAREKGYDNYIEYFRDRLSDDSGISVSGEEDDTEEEGDFDYELSDPETVGAYWKFTLDGHSFALPNALSEYLAAGYTIPDEDPETSMLGAGVTADRDLADASGENLFAELELYNPSDQEAPLADCVVIGFAVYELEDYEMDFALENGLTFGSTAEDAVAALGEPGFGEEGDFAQWLLDDDFYNTMYVDYDDAGRVIDLGIYYIGDYTDYEYVGEVGEDGSEIYLDDSDFELDEDGNIILE